ncbi:uncharacterized protein BX664DRAFT_310809 [Halteromyces radiatus]|uniref:uncharacterized protein n=1 Tax=Halteromyces radiatus TaxID=101107 RepID=UPI00221EF34A|nr:uncharacterized protein BX664DRAFT_310809 [Halteromyces radiatus]KAI8099883.1 hypothetical protein BX664DRAFT_310809 [Halteromyces radiatus]
MDTGFTVDLLKEILMVAFSLHLKTKTQLSLIVDEASQILYHFLSHCMEQEEQNMERYVQVRSPSLHQTLSFPVDDNTTVESLKKAIQSNHPQQPAPLNQRIIFRGKVLLDAEILSNILEKSDDNTVPTFHLVVKPSLSTPRSSSAPPTTQDTSNVPLSSSVPPSTTATDTMPFPPQHTFVPSLGQTSQNYLPTLPALVPGGYQVIAINGQFYLAPVLVASLPSTNSTNPTSIPFSMTGLSTSQAQQGYMPPPPPPPPTSVPTPTQAAAATAAARMMGRPRVMQRGATVWLALKLVFVLFITCHGASIERIIFFHFLALVFFMYQTGRFRLVIRRVTLEELQNRFQPAIPGGVAGLQEREGGGDQQQNEHDENQNTVSNSDRQQGQGQQERVPVNDPRTTTRLSVLKRGAYTFVASLWPNYGHDPRLAQAFQNEQEQMEEL